MYQMFEVLLISQFLNDKLIFIKLKYRNEVHDVFVKKKNHLTILLRVRYFCYLMKTKSQFFLSDNMAIIVTNVQTMN